MKKNEIYIFLTIILLLFLTGCTSNTQTPIGNAVCDLDGNCDVSSENQDGDYIRIPISEISSNVKKYSYDANGISINYFIVKSDEGDIKTAFDACDVCYRARKGYTERGKNMVCNNCGRVFPISGLGTENKNPGGCWPGYLPNKKEGGYIIINKSDLEAGRYRFA